MSEIVARIKGDASDFIRSLSEARAAVRDLQSAGASLATSLNTNLAGAGAAAAGANKNVSGLLASLIRIDKDGNASLATTIQNLKGVGKGAKQAETAVGALGKSFLGVAKFGAQVAGLQLGAQFVRDLAKQTIEIDRARASIATLVDDARLVDEITNKVRGIAAAAGFEAVDSIKALYEAISSGQEPAKALKIVETSAQLAKAGIADLAPTADLLTNVLNAYGISADKAGLVSDALFKTVEKGKTTIPELASSLGKILPVAAQANIDLTQLGGALAGLTIGGLSTAEAVTGLRSLFNNIIKPSSQAATLAKELGINFSTSAIQAKGFTGFIGDLKAKLDDLRKGGADTSNIIATLAGDPKAIVALASLTGSQFDKLVESQKAVTEGFGATAKAADKIKESFSGQLDVALETTKKELTDVGLAAGTFLQTLNNLGGTSTTQAGVITTAFKTITQGATAAFQAGKAGVETIAGNTDKAASSFRALGDTLANLTQGAATSRAGSLFASLFGLEDINQVKEQAEKVGLDFGKLFRAAFDSTFVGESILQAATGSEALAKGKELGAAFEKGLREKANFEEFEKAFLGRVDRLKGELSKGLGLDVDEIKATAAEFGVSIEDAINANVAPAVRNLFNPAELAAAFGDASAVARTTFQIQTAKGVADGAAAGIAAAAPNIAEGLAAGIAKGTPKLLAGEDLRLALAFKVETQFDDLRARVQNTVADLRALADTIGDSRATDKANIAIQQLEGGLLKLGDSASVARSLTEDELKKLLAEFSTFTSQVADKIDPRDLAALVGRFFVDLTKAPPPAKEAGKLISEGVRLADPPAKELSELLRDGVKLSKLTIDSPELQGLSAAEVATQLGGVRVGFDRFINENLSVGIRNVNERYKTVFIESAAAVRGASDRFIGEVEPGFEEVARTIERGGGRLAAAFESFNGLVETTSIQTKDLTDQQRTQVASLLAERERLIAQSRQAGGLGPILEARLLEIARVLAAFGGTTSVSQPQRAQGFSSGGSVPSGTVPGPSRGDRVPTLLEGGEFIVNARAARQNRDLLQAINSGFAGMRGMGSVRVGSVNIAMAGNQADGAAVADRLLRLGELGQLGALGRRT